MDSGPSRERITAARRHVQDLLESVAGRPGRAEGLMSETLAGLQRAVDALQEAEADLGDGIELPESRPAATGREARTVSQSLDWPAAILDLAPLVAVVVDHELQVVRVNRAAAKLAGQSAEQMHGCRAGNALRCLNALADPRGCGFGPSCGKCKLRQTVLDTHATGKAHRQVRARLPLRRDGGEVLVDLLISTTAFEDSGQRMVLAFVEDVSRIVQAEASLRTFLEALPESAFVMTPDGTVIEANEEVATRFGVSRDELLHNNIYHLVPEAIREARRQEAERVLRTGKAARFVDWRKGRCIENIIAPLPNPGGPVNGLAILGFDITDHEQGKADLRQSEARFRGLVENANDIIYVLALDGTFTYVSPNASTQLGFELRELLGRHYTDLVHPEDIPACDAFFQQVITTGKGAADVTYRLRCKNGNWLSHTSRASALTDDEGNAVSYLGISRDITEHKRQEALLLESEARYRQLVELAQDGIWALDASGHTTFANPRMAQMLGCTVAEMEGRAFDEFMDESQIAAAEACFRKRQEGQSEHHEFRFRRRDGSTLDANLATAPLQDAEGRFVGAFAVISDVTERKRFELELKRTLEATTDGIWTWDFTTDEVSFSPRYYTMLGYEPGEFPASFESWRDLIHPDDRAAALAVATEYIRTKPDVYENEFRLRNKRGEYRWIRAAAKVVERGPDGQAIRMIGNHEDITERKQAQVDLKRRTKLLTALRAAQSSYIAGGDAQKVFDSLLETLVSLTDSEFGFLDEVLYDDDGTPYKLSLAISNIAWDAESKALYEQLRARNLEFRNLDNLAGLPAMLGKPVIANDASQDSRAGGTPPGHPPIRAFMGLPLFFGGEIVGVIGIANRDGGYDERMAEFLEPFLATCSSIIHGVRQQNKGREAYAAALESEERFAKIFVNAPTLITLSALEDGRCLDINDQFVRATGYDREAVLGRSSTELGFITQEDRARILKVLERDGRVQNLELEAVRADGSKMICLYSGEIIELQGVRCLLSMAADITEHRQYQAQLEISEKRFRSLVEASSAGMWTTDGVGNNTYVSPRWSEITGVSASDSKGHGWSMGLHPDDRERVHREWTEAARSDRPYLSELRFVRSDGRVVWVLCQASSVRNADGEIVEWIGTITDVTDQKRVEHELRESEVRFRTLVESAPVSILAMRNGKYIFGNPASARLLGFNSPADFTGMDALACIAPEFHPKLLDRMKRVEQGEANEPIELQLVQPDGSRVWSLSTSVTVQIDGQRTALIVGQDITQAKQAEEMLRESERTLRSTLDALRESEERLRLANMATNDVIWDWDIVHDSQMWNPAGATVFGWSDITRHPQAAAWWAERVHPDDRQRVADGFHAVVHGPSQVQWQDEYRFRKADGSYATVMDRGYVMRDEQGRAVRMIGAMLDITDRKRAEEQLREALLWQKTAIAAGNVGFWDWDLQTNTVFYSKEWKTQIGYEEHEIRNGFDEWQTRVHPDDLEATLGIVREAVAEARPSWEVQYRFRHKDGSYRWILAQASVLCDDTGRAVRALGAHVDTTERKRAEEAQHAAERDKALVLDTTRELFARYDRDLRILWANKAAGASVGLAPEDLVGRHCYELWGQREEPCRGCAILRSMQTGRPEETEQVTPDGRVWHLRGYPVHGDDGRVIGAVELSQDITERKRANEALRESEMRYRTVADFTYDWETWIGRDGRLLYCSPSVKHLTGYSVEELLNDPALIGRMVHPDDRAAVEDHMHQERSEHIGVFSLDYRIVTKDGEERWVSHYCVPVYDDNGQHVGRRASTRDITDRKQLEEQLRQSQKLEAVGQLAGGVAHDFNNLLTAIYGHCDLLKAAVAESVEANHALEGIREAARQATGVTRSLLTFSAKLPSHKERVDLQELVRKSVHVLGRMLPASIDIVREPAEPLPIWLYADGVQLQQILMNLTINARDAMPDGGTLRITVDELSSDAAKTGRLKQADESAPEPARFARLTLSDTGTGMPPQVLSRVFEPFFTTKERGRGTGLGLAIVHGIVQEHNGHIKVDSVPGKGTTFTITLPVLESEPPAAVEKRAVNEARARGELVLLAEDDWNIRSLVATVLRDAGFEVCEASDGAALMARFAELADRVSLFVLDVDLPRRSGLDCLREIRASAADTPAIVITGGGGGMDANDLDRYTVLLSKPFSMGELKQQAAKLVCDRPRKEART